MNEPAEKSANKPAPTAIKKETDLRRLMRGLDRVLVAYSGGVDSAYLAAVATQELNGNAICVTGLSPSVSAFQRRHSADLAKEFGFNFFTVDTGELSDPNYLRNDHDRCFFCKDELYSVLGRVSAGYGNPVIVDGTNADDLGDQRPGRRAAEERNVRSPLAEIGLTKLEIRELSRELGLPTWDMPASPCLSSRIAHEVPVTIERLGKVERAEEYLRSAGFREFRVRVHGELARIEIAKDEIARAFDPACFDRIADEISKLGFRYVTLDMHGFRSGSLSRATVAGK